MYEVDQTGVVRQTVEDEVAADADDDKLRDNVLCDDGYAPANDVLRPDNTECAVCASDTFGDLNEADEENDEDDEDDDGNADEDEAEADDEEACGNNMRRMASSSEDEVVATPDESPAPFLPEM